jgi:hypothetical protein
VKYEGRSFVGHEPLPANVTDNELPRRGGDTVSGWTIFAICFTALLVGTWAAFTVFEIYRAEREVREVEAKGRAPHMPARGRRR